MNEMTVPIAQNQNQGVEVVTKQTVCSRGKCAPTTTAMHEWGMGYYCGRWAPCA